MIGILWSAGYWLITAWLVGGGGFPPTDYSRSAWDEDIGLLS